MVFTFFKDCKNKKKNFQYKLYMACKVENIYYVAFFRKSLPIPVLKDPIHLSIQCKITQDICANKKVFCTLVSYQLNCKATNCSVSTRSLSPSYLVIKIIARNMATSLILHLPVSLVIRCGQEAKF